MTAPVPSYPRTDTPCGRAGSVVYEGPERARVAVARCDCGWIDDVFYAAMDALSGEAAMRDLRAHYAGAL